MLPDSFAVQHNDNYYYGNYYYGECYHGDCYYGDYYYVDYYYGDCYYGNYYYGDYCNILYHIVDYFEVLNFPKFCGFDRFVKFKPSKNLPKVYIALDSIGSHELFRFPICENKILKKN